MLLKNEKKKKSRYNPHKIDIKKINKIWIRIIICIRFQNRNHICICIWIYDYAKSWIRIVIRQWHNQYSSVLGICLNFEKNLTHMVLDCCHILIFFCPTMSSPNFPRHPISYFCRNPLSNRVMNPYIFLIPNGYPLAIYIPANLNSRFAKEQSTNSETT